MMFKKCGGFIFHLGPSRGLLVGIIERSLSIFSSAPLLVAIAHFNMFGSHTDAHLSTVFLHPYEYYMTLC